MANNDLIQEMVETMMKYKETDPEKYHILLEILLKEIELDAYKRNVEGFRKKVAEILDKYGKATRVLLQ